MNYSPGKFDVVIFVYVCFMILKILCPLGIILSQQGLIFMVPSYRVNQHFVPQFRLSFIS